MATAANKQTEVKVDTQITPELIALIKNQVRDEVLAEIKANQDKKEEEWDAQSETRLMQEEKKMKDRLLEQPKRTIFIPDDPLNSNEPLPIVVNGVIFSCPRGMDIEVPQSVAEVWKQSYEATRKANSQIKVKEITEVVIKE